MQTSQRITPVNESIYIVHFCDRVAVKYEKLKRSKELRVRAIYLSFLDYSGVQASVGNVQPLLKARIDVRSPKYTLGQFEVRVSGIKLEFQQKAVAFIDELLKAIAKRDQSDRETAIKAKRLAMRPTMPPERFRSRVSTRQGATIFCGVGID